MGRGIYLDIDSPISSNTVTIPGNTLFLFLSFSYSDAATALALFSFVLTSSWLASLDRTKSWRSGKTMGKKDIQHGM